jgi:hypothetical protein
MRLASHTHYQHTDAVAAPVALPGNGRLPSPLPITGGERLSRPHALARRPMR